MKIPAISFIKSILIVLLFPITFYGQNVKIETTSLEVVSKKLQIQYDFIKSKKTHRFEVWVEISTLSGEKIDARTFNGDIGEGITGGKDKQIIWDYNADGIILNEEINVDLNATISTVPGAVKPIKELAKSIAFPGWGLSSIDNGKPYWLLGVVGYASLGTSIMLYSNSQKNYDKYQVTTDPNESTNLYDKSLSQNSLSQTFGYVAVGTWVISAVWTIVKATNVNGKLTANRKTKKLLFYSNYDPATKTSGFTVKYNF